MYKFSNDVSVEEYKIFTNSYSKCPITQDYRWANVKSNWDSTICGLYKEDKLVAASLLLIKRLPFGIKIIYAPRGFLVDYNDKELLEVFTKYIKNYAKSIRAFVVKIDPLIALNEYKMDNEDVPKNYSINNESMINNIKECGYVLLGSKPEIGAYYQPRFNMVIGLIDKDNKKLTETELLNSFKRNAKRYHGEFQDKRGVSFILTHSNEYMEDFCRIMNSTENRQSISLRNREYFENIMGSFKDDAYMFLAEVDINKFLNFLDNEIRNENEEEITNKYKSQKEDALRIKKEYGNKVCIAATLAITPPNKEGIKKVEYLYAGTDADLFPYLNSNASVHIYSFLYFLNLGYEYADLEGIDGNLNDHLSKTKEKYNPIIFEFVGEFDLRINKFLYFFFNKFNVQLKRIYFRITRLFKR